MAELVMLCPILVDHWLHQQCPLVNTLLTKFETENILLVLSLLLLFLLILSMSVLNCLQCDGRCVAALKYCGLVASEGGLAVLQQVVARSGTQRIVTLARTVIDHCTYFEVTRGTS